jgi:hypothetical protein
VDQDAFRSTYRSYNERGCVYEKAILTNHCACSQAHKFCIAEREGVHCGSDAAQDACRELLERLRSEARFALRATAERTALPHAKAMRIQVGGLRGIEAVLHPTEPVPAKITDIRRTVEAAIARYGSLAALPFGEIIRQVAAFRGRERRRRKTPAD